MSVIIRLGMEMSEALTGVALKYNPHHDGKGRFAPTSGGTPEGEAPKDLKGSIRNFYRSASDDATRKFKGRQDPLGEIRAIHSSFAEHLATLGVAPGKLAKLYGIKVPLGGLKRQDAFLRVASEISNRYGPLWGD